MINLLSIYVGFLILFVIFMYLVKSDNIEKIRNDIRELREESRELRAEIKHVGKLTIKTTQLVTREYSTLDDFLNNNGFFTCEVCGHRHKTPVPTCWGCGREVVSDDGDEQWLI